MKWKVQIEWLDDHDISLEDEYLIVTHDEVINDNEVFYYVRDEAQLESYMTPCNCTDWSVLGYTKVE